MCGSSTTVCAAYDYGTPAPIRRQRIKAPWRLRVASPCLALMIALLWSKPTQAQDSVLPDTYGDAGVEALLARARAARTRSVEGIESYEGRLDSVSTWASRDSDFGASVACSKVNVSP